MLGTRVATSKERQRESEMRKILVLSVLLVAATVPIGWADTWSFSPVVDEKAYEFGEVRIVRTIDATRNSRYPDFSITVYRAGELRALLRGVSFEHIAAPKDNSFFVGVSNDGLPGTAIIIFDAGGNLKVEIRHHFSKLKYCKRSITRYRNWYFPDAPDIAFEYYSESGDYHKAGDLKSISIRDCEGSRRDLFELIEQALGLEN